MAGEAQLAHFLLHHAIMPWVESPIQSWQWFFKLSSRSPKLAVAAFLFKLGLGSKPMAVGSPLLPCSSLESGIMVGMVSSPPTCGSMWPGNSTLLLLRMAYSLDMPLMASTTTSPFELVKMNLPPMVQEFGTCKHEMAVTNGSFASRGKPWSPKQGNE